MRILTAPEMRRFDQTAIEDLGIPGLVLMENAAIGVVDAIAERFPHVESVAIFCGPGNNGGDGLAIARHLDGRGYRLRVYLVVRRSSPRGDAAVQLEILQRAGIPVEKVGPESDLQACAMVCQGVDLVIDALFGTGLSRPLEGHFAALVTLLDGLPIPCLAVDLPSGLDGSRADVPGPCLQADLTVTFAALKVAHVFAPAAEKVGEVVVTDLGTPAGLLDRAELGEDSQAQLHLLTASELAACLVPRPAIGHKGTFGHALLVCGSSGKAGAAILAARAAVRGGAGLVTVAVPEAILATVDGGSLESMTQPLPIDEQGGMHGATVAAVLQAAVGKQAVAIGPGLGLAPATLAAVRAMVDGLSELPVVLDADALAAYHGTLGGSLDDLLSRRAGTVLTPHPGEMARLIGQSTEEVQAERLAVARQAAGASGAVVVLKGHQTLIASPSGDVYVNSTGNPGMATGGTGDVLTGLVASFLAQGYNPLTASQLAVYLHGSAGDVAAAELGQEALRASDLVAALPRAFQLLHEA